MGENLIVNYPNGKKIKDACKKIDFIVVQDTFLTETAQLADVVLPAATFAEKEGTFTNMGMTVQRLNKAIKPVGDAKPDWQIICSLSQKMGSHYSYVSPKDILTEIENISPMYAGINYDQLKGKNFTGRLPYIIKINQQSIRLTLLSQNLQRSGKIRISHLYC